MFRIVCISVCTEFWGVFSANWPFAPIFGASKGSDLQLASDSMKTEAAIIRAEVHKK